METTTICLIVFASILFVCRTFHVRADRPNVILIYTDDHGYTDLGVHGIDKHVDTPILDKLARGGTLMTAGYSSAPLDIRGKGPAILEKSAELSSFTGCDGYALSHYGGAPFENLRAVKRGLHKSKWAAHFT